MRRVELSGLAFTAIVASTTIARADDLGLYERLWPQVPDSQRATFSQQLQDQLTELGNLLGYHAAVLSHDLISFEVDARRRRAYVRWGGGDERLLSLRLASDIQFTEGLARVNTTIDLSFRGRSIELELPELEMVPASYRGDRGVEVRLPLLRRRW